MRTEHIWMVGIALVALGTGLAFGLGAGLASAGAILLVDIYVEEFRRR